MYTTNSTIYKIPYWSQSTQSSGLSNKRAAFIADSQLEGLGRIVARSCTFTVGIFSSIFSSGNSSITLGLGLSNYVFDGFISGVRISQKENLVWTGLPNSSTIYLYVSLVESNIYSITEQSSLSAGVCSPSWNTSGITPADSILVGKATIDTSTITINDSTPSDNSQFSSGRPFSLDIPQLSVLSQGNASGLAAIGTLLSGLSYCSSSLLSIDNSGTSFLTKLKETEIQRTYKISTIVGSFTHICVLPYDQVDDGESIELQVTIPATATADQPVIEFRDGTDSGPVVFSISGKEYIMKGYAKINFIKTAWELMNSAIADP